MMKKKSRDLAANVIAGILTLIALFVMIYLYMVTIGNDEYVGRLKPDYSGADFISAAMGE